MPNNTFPDSYAKPSGNDPNRPGLNWDMLPDKETKTLDGHELGTIKEVATDYIYTEKGTFRKKKYFIPRRFADRFDGRMLWFNITKDRAENEFKREIPPAVGEYASKYTTVETVEKRITERKVEIGPGGERKEKVEEKTV